MSFDVSDEAGTKTEQSSTGFCLAEGTRSACGAEGAEEPTCTVQSVAGRHALWVMPSGAQGCSHLTKHGDWAFTCSCPERNEIYRKHRRLPCSDLAVRGC